MYVKVVDVPSDRFPEYDPDASDPVPEIVMPPPAAEIVIPPVKVFVADNVNVPDPDFVNVPAPVAMGSATAVSPTPAKVNPKAPLNALPDETSNVSVPSSLPIDAVAPSVTAPVIEFVSVPAVETLRIAPADEIPVPDTVNGSAIDRLVPEILTAPPESIVVPTDEAPKEAFADTTTVEPLDTVVKPVYVFVADNVNVPASDFVNVEIGVAIGSATVTFPTPTNEIVGVPEDAPIADPLTTSNVSVPASLPIDAFAPSVIAPVIVLEPEPDTLRIAPADEIPVPDTVNGSAIDRLVPEILTAPAEIVVPAELAPSELSFDTTTAPALTEVAPVYVFVADNVNVPDPDFVNVPVPVAIGSATVVFPTPSNVNPKAPLNALPDETSKVSVPESD